MRTLTDTSTWERDEEGGCSGPCAGKGLLEGAPCQGQSIEVMLPGRSPKAGVVPTDRCRHTQLTCPEAGSTFRSMQQAPQLPMGPSTADFYLTPSDPTLQSSGFSGLREKSLLPLV